MSGSKQLRLETILWANSGREGLFLWSSSGREEWTKELLYRAAACMREAKWNFYGAAVKGKDCFVGQQR